MNMIVIGCGRIGAELAYRMYCRGHRVVVVDRSETAFHNLPNDFRGRTVQGDAMGVDVLRRADIESANGLAVVTGNDQINAVVAHLARIVYNVPMVVVRNFNTRWRPMQEVFGLQMVSPSSWAAQRIEELLYQQSIRTVFSSGNGEVELYEFAVPQTWDGRRLADLLPEQNCVAASLTRAGRAVLPNGSESLKTGDIVLVSATLEGSETLLRQLNNPPSA
jgi:trk system potassium uptake protein TrkA